jgi:2-hydroxycyclohexanecarboxyl-CoA dehydrogenase
MSELSGQVALVAGAARGIGRASAVALARAGADVAVLGIRPERLVETAAEIRTLGRRCLELGADVADEAQVAEAVARTVRELGRLDVLVNSAVWFDPPAALLDTTRETWERVLAVDLGGAFHLSKHAARAMLERGTGRVLHISSESGKRGSVLRGAYSAAKAGLNTMVTVLSEELAHTEIKVNAVCPMGVAGEHNQQMRAALATMVGRPAETDAAYSTVAATMTQPEEIAGIVVFLASDAGRRINGQHITVGELKASGVAQPRGFRPASR